MPAAHVSIDQANERAAIMEYCGGMARAEAEKQAAMAYGYASWSEMVKEIRDET